MTEPTNGVSTLAMVDSACSICGTREMAKQIAEGEDFEYRTSPDRFTFYLCGHCDALFLHPRPDRSEIPTIYPDNYHAYGFTDEEFGFSYRMRRWIEKRRLLDWCSTVPPDGVIVDVGAGDGFHLDILRRFGDQTWTLEAVEPDRRAAVALEGRGIRPHVGFLDEVALASNGYDMALMIMVIEHVDDPLGLLKETFRILRPGGRVGIVTDNIGSPDARISRRRYWGGYHFPRHFNLYGKESLTLLGEKAGFELAGLNTMMSPVNWTYSVHNRLAEAERAGWLVDFFSLKSPLALARFSAMDMLLTTLGHGALLRARFRKPA